MCDVQVQNKHRERILQLSKPKDVKTIWITSHGPRVQWGTQETLWPVNDDAKNAPCTPRLAALSRPKTMGQGGDKGNQAEFMYSCGRRSVIWEVSNAAKSANPSDRLLILARPKQAPDAFVEDRDHFVFSCGRPSQIWETTRPLTEPPPRPRTERLAETKSLHPDYKPLRGVATVIPETAVKARLTQRVDSLASPKIRSDGPFREPRWPVSAGARTAAPTNRCVELSRPKTCPDAYRPARDTVWDITRAAKRAVPNQRMEELAKPIVRATMDHVQFDPDAFLVKEGALKGRCSRRVDELAQPIKR